MRENKPVQMMVQIRNIWPALCPEERALPRSRLYNVAPYNIGTPWCESLTGYINRLGWTHHVPPRALVAQEIVPRLDEGSRLAVPVAMFGTKSAMSLNGAGVATKPWTLVLNHLTSRDDLPFLTLPFWVGDLSPRWQLRETPAWCPSCISDWRTNGQPLYQPLHWMMRIVTFCPRHQTPLIDQCPRCQKRQLVFAPSKTQPGECTSCGYALGTLVNTLSPKEESSEHYAWQEWVWRILQELQVSMRTDGLIPWEAFFRHLATYLREQKGHSRLARVTGIDRPVLYRWIDPAGVYSPTLEAILKLCYVCQITPCQVMNGQLDQLQQTLQAGTERRSPLPHRQNRRFDREQCQTALQAALDNNEPQSLRQVAQQLGLEDAHQLMYHFPQECKLVIQRAKAYRQQRKVQRLIQVREQVRQAVLFVHAQGLYPSHRKLRGLLPGALMRLSEAKEAWHVVMQELGYEL